MKYLPVLAAFLCVWVPLSHLLLWLEIRIRWNVNWKGPIGLYRAVTIVLRLVRLSIVVLLAAILGAPLVGVTLPLPAPVIALLALVWPLTLALLEGRLITGHLRAHGLTATDWKPASKSGARLVLEETAPLRSEIITIAGRFGIRLETIEITTLSRKGGSRGVPLADFSRGKLLTIVRENLLFLSPNAVTAALSRLFAAHVKSDPIIPFRFSRDVRTLAGAASLLTVLVGFPEIVRGTPAGLFFAAAVVMMLFGVPRMLGLRRTAYQALCDAYRVWIEADPRANRTVRDFVMALCEYHAFTHAVPPQLAVHQMGLERAMVRFLRRFDGGTPRDVCFSTGSPMASTEQQRARS